MEDEASADSSVPRPSLEERRASVFARLAQRHKSRTEQSLARRSDSGDAAPIFENSQAFLRSFSDADRCIRSKIETIRSASNARDASDRLKAELEAIAVQIADLEKQVAENSYFLASYDVRSSQKVIAELKEQLGGANEAILPRKKFSFGFKPVKTEKNPVLMETEESNGASLKNGHDVSASVDEGSNFSVRETPGFRNQQGVLLVKDFKDTRDGDFAISDLGSCEVYLKGCSRAVFVHRLRGCRVHIGPVIGSILIEDVEDCIFMVACHQIRIHEAKRTDFYIRVRSKPIIEFCNGVRFAPYAFSYKGMETHLKESGLSEETGNWRNVDDFRWLRASPSPNWCLISEEERSDTVNFDSPF